MFGYIVVNQPELKMKEYDEYRKYYCGLCKSLKDRYGARGQISLSYDMTFLVLLLTGLYEPEKHSGSRRCIAHPTSKHTYVQNEYTDYVADMNVILTYYKCIDDWDDEHMLTRKLYADVARGQISLSYDMTFLVLLLTGLYEPEKHSGSRRCIAHPTSKHTYVQNEYTDYVADMNVILTYYKCIDDWDDEHMLTRKLYADVLLAGQNGRRLKEDYQQKIQVIAENLKAISELEEVGSDDMDALSGHFGNIMAEICAPKHDEWESYLRTIGYYLGKFVYIMDAYDDIEKDIGAGNYNPFVCRLAHELGVEVQSVGVDKTIEQDKWQELAEWTKDVLMMMVAPLAKEYEMLPIIENVGILRNIIYSGIWEAYYSTTNRRCGDEE